MLVSIIVPAYNEEQTIGILLTEIMSQNFDFEYEIIVIDDGSSDKTFEVLQRFDNIAVVRFPDNGGKGAAIKAGISKAKGGVILLQDADLEYCPKDIPQLVSPIIEDGVDVVYGSRFLRGSPKMGISHFIGNKILTWATNVLFQVNLTDMETGYKVIRRDILDELDILSDGFEIEPEITSKLLKRKINIREVPISYSHRKKGNSKICWMDGAKSLILLIESRFNL